MSATVPMLHRVDDSLKRFADARDLPPDLQRETIEELLRSDRAELRQRALRAGAALFDDATLVRLLREDADDVMRNAGLEMLKFRGRSAFPVALSLLADEDADVVLQAVLVLDSLRDPRAWPALRPLLTHADTNVVQATIMAAGHLGGAAAAANLTPFLSADPWLQVAAIQALGDLRCASAVTELRSALDDDFLQQFAAEALARIGGMNAFRALSGFWLSAEADLDVTVYLQLLATMVEQFERPPRNAKLRAAAERYVHHSDPSTAAAAAVCVLVFGPSDADAVALQVIASAVDGSKACPAALRTRADLAEALIRHQQPLRDWGYEILAQSPAAIAPRKVAALIDDYRPANLESVGGFLVRSGGGVLAETLLALWIERVDEREALTAAVRQHRRRLLNVLATCTLAPTDRIPLLEAMRLPAGKIPEEIATLPQRLRWEVISQVRTADVARLLPWGEWLVEHDETTVRAFADAVSRTTCRTLLPVLRSELTSRPQRELIAAAGDLRDTESVPILARLVAIAPPLLRASVFDSLGRIGGAAARVVLRSYCRAEAADPQACRALAMCAEAEDGELLRAFADSPDVSVRLAIITPLMHFGGDVNVQAVRRLLFDPSNAVSQKAHAALDRSRGMV